MNEDIQNIGRFNYLWTIFIGKNREIAKITKRIYNKNGYDEENINGDFIITIGNKAIILTKYRNGRREPIIVRKWQTDKKIQKDEDFTYNFIKRIEKEKSPAKIQNFIDNAGYRWKYFVAKDFLGRNEFIDVYKPKNGNLIYTIQIK